jgi:hypothetical protein
MSSATQSAKPSILNPIRLVERASKARKACAEVSEVVANRST